jgi:hydrogenase-4 membrane subunit HyfE
MTIVSWLAVVLIFAASLTLLIIQDWRWSLALLALLYLGVFWLTQIHWTLSMAAVKLVTGWMVATILGITRAALDPKPDAPSEQSWRQGRFFRVLAAISVVLLVLSATPIVVQILPGIGLAVVAGSLILMAMGLLLLGLTDEPLRVVIGLLSFIAGFEIIYAAVENAILVAALLALINLGLALVGSYLLLAGTEEETGRSA